MAGLIEDIAKIIINGGLAQAIGIDVFMDARPDHPDSLISIFDTGGYPAEAAIPELKRTVQIIVRNISYVEAKENAWGIYNVLDKPGDRVTTVDGRKMFIRAIQTPTRLERDASNRSLFVFNVQVWTSRN